MNVVVLNLMFFVEFSFILFILIKSSESAFPVRDERLELISTDFSLDQKALLYYLSNA